MLVDTHCHFNHERFADDLPECLERAQAADVRQMIVVGYDLSSSAQAVTLAETHAPLLFAAVAIHPHDAKSWTEAAAERLRELAQHPRVVAIGEIGLDFHYDFSPRPAQFAAFRAQMLLAQEASLPVIIHCREAYPETLAVLAEMGADDIGGVMHCWAGSPEDAQQTVALGMSLGFGGTLTFKNAQEVRTVAQSVPLENLLLETDAPYLAPMPYRGKRNEPAYTRLVAEALASLRSMTFAEIAALTTGNAHRLFPRLQGEF
jgi:TatD DNase family protein